MAHMVPNTYAQNPLFSIILTYPVETDVSVLVLVFIYVYSLCMRAGHALLGLYRTFGLRHCNQYNTHCAFSNLYFLSNPWYSSVYAKCTDISLVDNFNVINVDRVASLI